jgi:hypothetical protein
MVFDESVQGWQRWTFDLESGTRAITAGEPPGPPRDEATRRIEPPFLQRLLPMDTGDNWEIPALVNTAGQVLVMSDAGAQWLNP